MGPTERRSFGRFRPWLCRDRFCCLNVGRGVKRGEVFSNGKGCFCTRPWILLGIGKKLDAHYSTRGKCVASLVQRFAWHDASKTNSSASHGRSGLRRRNRTDVAELSRSARPRSLVLRQFRTGRASLACRPKTRPGRPAHESRHFAWQNCPASAQECVF